MLTYVNFIACKHIVNLIGTSLSVDHYYVARKWHKIGALLFKMALFNQIGRFQVTFSFLIDILNDKFL